MLTFKKYYLCLAVLIFVIETLIALYVHDDFVRPYLGDVLVVMLIYCFLKSFVKLSVWTAAIIVLVFSFGIEFLQFVNIVEKLGLEHSKTARTVIGTSFAWEDLLCYLSGIVIILAIEKLRRKTV